MAVPCAEGHHRHVEVQLCCWGVICELTLSLSCMQKSRLPWYIEEAFVNKQSMASARLCETKLGRLRTRPRSTTTK